MHPSGDDKSGWKATTGQGILVLILTVATAMFFKSTTPQTPLSGVSLAFVAFAWFLIVFAAGWIWKRARKKRRDT
jgi:Na+/proline symporter